MNDAYNVSILDQVKTQIGYPADVRVFDNAIIPVVNSALAFLHQVGIGPSIPFMITGPTETWADFGHSLKPILQLRWPWNMFISRSGRSSIPRRKSECRTPSVKWSQSSKTV